ncbi:MAG: hypothetical protein NWP41_06615, partial [Ilumatobacteraceae bacterium]|nr:hypothetical protein [Ilumatobacteraceae bacterium]
KEITFWKMAATAAADLQSRAEKIVEAAKTGEVCALDSIPGAGSAPGATIDSFGIVVIGDHLTKLRMNETPIIARVKDNKTFLDLRTIQPDDDEIVVRALQQLAI